RSESDLYMLGKIEDIKSKSGSKKKPGEDKSDESENELKEEKSNSIETKPGNGAEKPAPDRTETEGKDE
ncbi:MAG: hypothetical protein ACQESO_07790, partial [Bacillota bacterium]